MNGKRQKSQKASYLSLKGTKTERNIMLIDDNNSINVPNTYHTYPYI